MGLSSRRKGAEGEREFWTRLAVVDPECTIGRRLDSARDGGHDGVYRGVSLEIKRHRRLSLSGWYTQALAQADGEPCAIAFRVDRGEWQILPIMGMDEFVQWAKVREAMK